MRSGIKDINLLHILQTAGAVTLMYVFLRIGSAFCNTYWMELGR